jgi:hypothetical protein
MVLMEDKDGKISIEMYADPVRGKELYDTLSGKPGDPPSRATYLTIDWVEGLSISGDSKVLPVIRDPLKEPWGIELGVGPIEEPEKAEDESGD